MYAVFPSGVIANPDGPSNPPIVPITVFVAISIIVTVVLLLLVTYAFVPSALIVTVYGSSKLASVMVVSTVLVSRSNTLTVSPPGTLLLLLLVTYANRSSGVIAIADGVSPTAIVAMSLFGLYACAEKIITKAKIEICILITDLPQKHE